MSRQAVYDNIKRTENLLEHYEENLKLYEKNTKRNALLIELRKLIKEDVSEEKILTKLEKIANID